MPIQVNPLAKVMFVLSKPVSANSICPSKPTCTKRFCLSKPISANNMFI